jgi:hypothetical protein
MRPIPDRLRSISGSPTSWEAGSPANSSSREEGYQDLVWQANTVPITKIFRFYGLRLDEINKKATCPFKGHKDGRESSPSFYYYPETNSFYCFGCSIGGKGAHGCRFVALMDRTNDFTAAHKILELFSADVDESIILDDVSAFSERLEIMMDFSNTIREFHQANPNEKSLEFVEKICAVYDAMNLKHDLNNEALGSMVEQLKDRVRDYKP